MVKIVKNPGNGRLNNLNNLNHPVLNVLRYGMYVASHCLVETCEEFGKTPAPILNMWAWLHIMLNIVNFELFHWIKKLDVTKECKSLINLADRQDSGQKQAVK